MKDRVQIHDGQEIDSALTALAEAIYERHGSDVPVLIGIRRGGMPLAERLAELLGAKYNQEISLGVLDINLYRDDWTRARSFPKVGRTEIPVSLEDRLVILVDDVLFTGRTVRAALDVLTDFGRASRIELATLVDRGHREMPIEANYASFVVNTLPGEIVEVEFSEDGPGQGITLIRDLDDSPK
ncbi:MAG: bifunctional pyr operon transcriptional regulator/uracil phosphoribosyltransferase PyrR [Deltaproteobacteria bacterium]|jgi:pyrimidine operon attenuation protein/uracil phosphoribosyltransferase|nr:bifunctional pyr operon transcriptional regulator/uracil phosphoribosyltransferase PyrR [Deltaproteobacteria bacterium]